jgi:hypothetical protein
MILIVSVRNRKAKPLPFLSHIPDGGEHGYDDEEKNQEDQAVNPARNL